jgi:hypothetical protein
LVWFLLRAFGGAVDNIIINPSTGGWTWNWNSNITTVTSTDPAVSSFFRISSQSGRVWTSSSLIDLSGTKVVCVGCCDFQSDAYFSSIPGNQNYICSVPVDETFPNVIVHAPGNSEMVVNWFGSERMITSVNICIMDPSNNSILPLTSDYQLELKFFITRPINQ